MHKIQWMPSSMMNKEFLVQYEGPLGEQVKFQWNNLNYKHK